MILERIRELLVEQLNLDYEHLQADTRFDEIGADSIDVVELVMALEAELGPILVPGQAQLCGALGAALIALE